METQKGESVMVGGSAARVRSVRVTLLILTLLLSALFLFPYVFLALSSFKPAQEVITIPPTFFPKTFSIENYQEMYNYINVEKSLLNSFVSAFGSTAIAVLLGALSAFALVRANSKLSAILLAMVFFLKMIPLSAIAVPIYRIITSFGLYDTRIALVIALAATNMPLVIWIMIGFFQSVPVSLDEAACVDGASSLVTFFRVILPVSVPGIATAGILTLFLSWNDFLLSLMLTSANAKTFTVSLSEFLLGYQVNLGPMTAASFLFSFPIIILAIFAQKYIIQGLTAGAVKE
ncbi:carbohydrate ABC transporter permease [Ruthenibacterium lactatiformans]|uniref:carbohydrate ABC transporter permease n=1 Tax=Ruthenibacterium lactatiformans TaxID=1550024 RepID=UPI0039F4A86B